MDVLKSLPWQRYAHIRIYFRRKPKEIMVPTYCYRLLVKHIKVWQMQQRIKVWQMFALTLALGCARPLSRSPFYDQLATQQPPRWKGTYDPGFLLHNKNPTSTHIWVARITKRTMCHAKCIDALCEQLVKKYRCTVWICVANRQTTPATSKGYVDKRNNTVQPIGPRIN